MELSTSLKVLSGIGPRVSASLEKLELKTVDDLINHYPFRYDDFSNQTDIARAKVGEVITIRGQIWSIKNVYTRHGKVLTQAIINDGANSLDLIWFNQPWLTKNIHGSDYLQVSGKLNKSGSKLSIVSPKWEKISSNLPTTDYQLPTIHTGRLVPVYPETYGLTSKWIRAKIAQILPVVIPKVNELLPDKVRDGMMDLPQALHTIHFPDNYQELARARERLAFDELFYIQLATLKTRLDWQKKEVVEPLKINTARVDEFISKLPFKLTSAQKKVIDEVLNDLGNRVPMNRLVQGEVGSGKTVIAAVIAFVLAENNLVSLFMAPTEILAFQHYDTFTKLLEPWGYKVGIYTGHKKSPEIRIRKLESRIQGPESRKKARLSTLDSIPSVIIGTHALVAKNFKVEGVGLIIIDEQQRFGVKQRAILRSHAKLPHFLTMTATPIPRTVALTFYGDLDLSVIDELPPGRQLVKTHFVPEKKRSDAYKFIEKKIQSGDQVYIITPLIEESETLASAKAAKVEYQRLKDKIFPHLRLGLLHGRLKSTEKQQVLTDFKAHEFDILVSTSVVEVGVDVTNATIIVVEGAERFGLAQLHQLRGRVGRGSKVSFCFLFAQSQINPIVKRLKSLETIHNGLKLAELDLKIRGSGEIFGKRQSGRLNLKIASLSDIKLINQARKAALNLLEDSYTLDKYPLLRGKLDNLVALAAPD